MLFTEGAFAFLYLPLVLAGYFLIGRWRPAWAPGWLLLASLFFYGYWMPVATLLLLASIGVNFRLGMAMVAAHAAGQPRRARAWLVAGLVANLGLLGYFKYANFFVDNLNTLLGSQIEIGRVLLPLGISFFTFTQIAFLVDTWQGKVREARLVHYGLFVTYFPHLVAGPVLHHAQMMPQFASPAVLRPDAVRLVGGLAIFGIGLFKKVVLADGVAPYADAVFNPVDAGGAVPTLQEAWLAALAYTFQLYFDFSGYSDMAIGLSWLFNIRLPWNFDSPYQALNISEFWHRWHISLSNFLRDYLYVPLGGNRLGEPRRYANLATTMLLGGLWHGASWSFVLWGGLHGLYLMLHHAWRAWAAHRGWWPDGPGPAWRLAGWALTFVAVVVAWVPFRATTLAGAGTILQAMAGLGGAPAAEGGIDRLLWQAGLQPLVGWGWCAVLAAVAWLAPNSNRIGEALMQRLAASERLRWAAAPAVLLLVVGLVVVNTAREAASAFIYFNF